MIDCLQTVRHPSRSIKYALAIVITLDNSENDPLLDLIFSHFAVIENKLHQLQAVAFKLLCNYFRRTSPRQMQLSGPNSVSLNPVNFLIYRTGAIHRYCRNTASLLHSAPARLLV
jgi:hypothetical protein